MNRPTTVRRAMCLVVAGIACATIALAQSSDEPLKVEGDEPSVQLPITFNKVWFREQKRKGLAKLKVFKHNGFLTVTEDGFDFVGGKNSYFFPLEDIEMLSLGTMGNDVNTDWVVLSIRQEGTTRIVGMRDGHAWGYGNETLTIYRRLHQALKQLGAGPYASAEGYVPYDRLRHQLVLDYPEGWTAFVVRSVYVGEGAAYGRVVFSPRDVDSLTEEMKEQRGLPEIEAGRELAILFDRAETTSGMDCDKLKPDAREAILERVGRYPLFEGDVTVLEAPTVEETTVAGCNALRITARVRHADGVESILDARVFANRRTLFTLGARAPADRAEQATETVDAMVDSILLPLAYRSE